MTSAPSIYRLETHAALRLAMPIIFVHLGSMLMGTVDVMMLGRVSKVALASGGIGNSIAFGLLVFPMGLISALDPLASQAYGAGNALHLSRYFKQGLVVAVVASIPISLIMWDARALLELLAQPPEIVDGASAYLRTVMPGSLAFLLYIALQRTLQSMSIVRPAFVAIVIANVANFVTDYLLIFGKAGFPELGVEGAGWATSVSRWVMVLCLAAFSARPLSRYMTLKVKDLTRITSYGTFVRIGIPIGVHTSLEYWLFGCVSLIMGYLGPLEASSHQVAINLSALAFMVVLGMGEAAATRVGNAIGRGDMAAARCSAVVCTGLGFSTTLLAAALFWSLPEFLSRLYTSDAAIVALASVLVPIAGVYGFFDGIQAVCAGVLRGAADTKVPATMALIGYWLLGLPCGILLAFWGGMGPVGLWWGLTFGLMSVAVLLLLRVVRKFRTEIIAVDD